MNQVVDRSLVTIPGSSPELLHVWPEVRLGAGEAQDPDNLHPALVHLLVKEAVHTLPRARGPGLPPEPSEPENNSLYFW